MTTSALLLADHHVHSTFSDGKNTVEENIEQAEHVGLTHLGCVDHVRVDTTYVPDYVAAIRSLRATTKVVLTIGIEAKILDTDGRLDLPATGLDGVDRVYVADHQFPWPGEYRSPRTVRAAIEEGNATAAQCIEHLVTATVAAMRGYQSHPLVLAHLFSILPKVGLSEAQVPDELLALLATTAADTGTIVEISERWKCPSVRALRLVQAAGGEIVCSTDSHAIATMGRYEYVRSALAEVAS